MLKKSYKVLSEKELSKLLGGWGYWLTFRSPRSWENAILKWIKR